MKKTMIAILSLGLAMSLLTGCGSNGTEFTANKPINVTTREPGSGTRGAFVELFGIEEKNPDGTKKDLITKDAGTENNTNAILSTIQNDVYAIGYVSMGSLGDTVKTVKIDGVEATTENVKNGTYKVSRPFNIVVKDETNEVANDFIDYILSKEGQEITAKKYIAVDDHALPYSGNKPSGSLTVGGSSSVAPLMEELIEGYKLLNPNATIQLQITDSTTGVNSTIEGSYTIGMASRELKDSEKEKLTEVKIALDGIAVIINKDNAVTDLSREDVKKIYVGDIETWAELNK